MRRKGHRGFLRGECDSGILVGARRWMGDRLLGVELAVEESVSETLLVKRQGMRWDRRVEGRGEQLTGNFSLGLVFSFPSSSGSYSQGRA